MVVDEKQERLPLNLIVVIRIMDSIFIFLVTSPKAYHALHFLHNFMNAMLKVISHRKIITTMWKYSLSIQTK